MSKLASAFGDVGALRIKSFELGGHKFKVRIPLTKERDEMNERMQFIDPDRYKARFEKVTKSLEGEQVERTDDDVIVDGRSTKDLIETAMRVENRIVEFIRLLVPDNGDMSDITYDDIEAEWPFTVQLEMLKAISEAIEPTYGDARKNS